uniref:Uncharacterized protein n=1 Tax=Candidatus Kentrum sp. SD TaxID=2126332 RepID=A0A450YGJ8_9GAMM|nr:MAG: hypothetical protein BECKSD772F_GA0070984_106515 [Candidatus Kentron sp. SD]VFK45807.1 MAG: hypothetical protein BECKSD772E_GA0070983_106017 [Candidatus Kentron sp. SD]VFK79784.1 MAG: hypothetical protein BECKSD772D_GA0070982_106515 [Candidatus Kentron sp. SD]
MMISVKYQPGKFLEEARFLTPGSDIAESGKGKEDLGWFYLFSKGSIDITARMGSDTVFAAREIFFPGEDACATFG